MRKTVTFLLFLTLVLTLAEIAPTLLEGRDGVSTDPKQVLGKVRTALGRDPEKPFGVRMNGTGRALGMDVTTAMLWDGSGRYTFSMKGEVNLSTGHDGETTWNQTLSGDIHRSSGTEAIFNRIPFWFITGDWIDQGDELRISAVSSGAGANRTELQFNDPEGKFTATVVLDNETWLPVKLISRNMGQDLAVELKKYIFVSGHAFPLGAILINDGKVQADMDFHKPEIVQAFEPGAFNVPGSSVQFRFLTHVSSRLKVQRGSYGHLFVSPTINGHSVGWFAFDTGADSTVIDIKVARELKLKTVGESSAVGVGGGQMVGLHHVDVLKLGPVELNKIALTSSPLRKLGLGFLGGPAGLLGMDILSHVVVYYDLENSVIELHDPKTYELPAGKWYPMKSDKGSPTIDLRFEGHEGIFSIDTGSPGGILISPHTVKRLDLLRGRKTRSGRVGGLGGGVDSRTGTLDWVEWGGKRLENVPARFVTEEKGAIANRMKDGTIGTDLIGRGPVVFDFTNERIGFVPRSVEH